MHPFRLARPTSLDEAIGLLVEHGPNARALAGGTDLVIALRDGEVQPTVVVDLKRIPELGPGIERRDGWLVFRAGTVMADIVHSPEVGRVFPALAEAAAVVGSVQIRNRATLAGNICNGSPAADTAPPLLVFDAVVAVVGPRGPRRMPLDEFIVDAGRVALGPGELVTAIELPLPTLRTGSAFTRLVRRRGTDLASITMACAVRGDGLTRIAYGSVGPRAVLFVDETGTLADPAAATGDRAAILERCFAPARPSPTSLRAGPEYRRAMLGVLGRRALDGAIARLREAA